MTSYHSISKVDAEDAEEPVTLAEAKSWLRVASNDDDANIGMMIKGARQSLEQYLNRAIVKSDVTVVAHPNSTGNVRLPYAETFNAVVVTDNDFDAVPVDDYTVRGSNLALSPPAYYAGPYTIAYTIDPTVPEALKEAILMEVAQRYTNRGENVGGSGMSEAAKQKADPFKIIWL